VGLEHVDEVTLSNNEDGALATARGAGIPTITMRT